MTVQVNVEAQKIEGAERLLRRIALRTGDVGPALRSIGSALEASTQQRFLDERGPDGNKWEEHSPVTTALRGGASARAGKGTRNRKGQFRRRGTGNEILRDRMHLFDSIGSAVNGAELRVGANRIYARIHQLGGQAGPGRKVTIPARPYLGINAQDEQTILQTLRDHLEVRP